MSGWVRMVAGGPAPIVSGADAGRGDCIDEFQDGPLRFACTRAYGHPGRHLAGVGGDTIVAAWPGAVRPTEADLTEVPS